MRRSTSFAILLMGPEGGRSRRSGGQVQKRGRRRRDSGSRSGRGEGPSRAPARERAEGASALGRRVRVVRTVHVRRRGRGGWDARARAKGEGVGSEGQRAGGRGEARQIGDGGAWSGGGGFPGHGRRRGPLREGEPPTHSSRQPAGGRQELRKEAGCGVRRILLRRDRDATETRETDRRPWMRTARARHFSDASQRRRGTGGGTGCRCRGGQFCKGQDGGRGTAPSEGARAQWRGGGGPARSRAAATRVFWGRGGGAAKEGEAERVGLTNDEALSIEVEEVGGHA